MRKGQRLTEKQAAFVAAYEGPGTGRAAATAAGYGSSVVTASRAAGEALRTPVVIAALEARAKAEGRPELVPAPGAKRAPKAVEGPRLEPRSKAEAAAIGTTTERVADAMKVARDRTMFALAKDKNIDPALRLRAFVEGSKVRLRALETAARIAGEIGAHARTRPRPPSPLLSQSEPGPEVIEAPTVAPISVPEGDEEATVDDLAIAAGDRVPFVPGRKIEA